MTKYEKIFKIVLIGNTGAGKSSIMFKLTDDQFTESFISTIGVDFRMETFNICGCVYKLQIWDTAGQERFASIVEGYYKHAHGIIIVYDVTDRKSFEAVERWMASATNIPQKNVAKLLLGNKIDKTGARVVSTNEGKSLANKLGIQFMEVSAKTGSDIRPAFERMIELILENDDKQKNDTIDIVEYHDRTPKGCCGGSHNDYAIMEYRKRRI